MNSNSGKFLGELEKEIMGIIWKNDQQETVRSVFETLSKKRKIAYTTVMTIMNRLVNKGLLKRSLESKVYSYEAVYSKDRFLTKMSKQIIKNFVSSFGDAAIASFIHEVDKIPADKKRKLLKLLKEANA